MPRLDRIMGRLLGREYGAELLCKEYRDYEAISRRPRAKVDLLAVLDEGCRVLQRVGATFWIERGTLLGWHRDKAFLPGDFDLDVSVVSDDLVPQIVRSMPFDLLFEANSFGRTMQLTFIDNKTEILFDIWFFHERGARLYNRNYFGKFWLPRERVMQLDRLEFSGTVYNVLSPDWYCHYWYGDRWRTPKSYPKDWSIPYREDCKGFQYLGVRAVEYAQLWRNPPG